jgi:anti-sigma factor RsiW
VTCQQFVEFTAGYLEGELPADARRHFDEHLAICPDCVRYLAQYRDTIKVGRLACEDALPPDVPEDLVRAILAARKQK